jgi:hypothetical protein
MSVCRNLSVKNHGAVQHPANAAGCLDIGDQNYPTTVVILNGPPECGKNTVANSVISLLKGQGRLVCKREFKSPLMAATRRVYGIDSSTWGNHCTKDLVNVPWDRLNGLSPQQALNRTSENVLKFALGDDILGHAAATRLEPDYCHIFCDGASPNAVQQMVTAVGAENVLIIHMARIGCTFEGDGQSYIKPGILGTQYYGIANDNSISHIAERITSVISEKLSVNFEWDPALTTDVFQCRYTSEKHILGVMFAYVGIFCAIHELYGFF